MLTVYNYTLANIDLPDQAVDQCHVIARPNYQYALHSNITGYLLFEIYYNGCSEHVIWIFK